MHAPRPRAALHSPISRPPNRDGQIARPAAAGPTLHPRVSTPEPTPLATLADALTVVGDRWTLLVVAALLGGPRRFGELESDVTGIAPNVLTQRLRHLEGHGLVIARPYSRRPPRVVYELSESGRALAAPLRLLAGWGATRSGGAGAPRHAACGTPMEVRWWCPVCEEAVPESAIEEDPGEELHFA